MQSVSDSSQPSLGPTDGPAHKPVVPCTAVRQLAQECARAIFGEWDVGTSSRFCDDPADWDAADFDDVVERLERTLNANSGLMREAGKPTS